MADVAENPIIQPPKILKTVTHPETKEQSYAFPLQTEAWLKMQDVIQLALQFPLSSDNFVELYGKFADQAEVNQAAELMKNIRDTANQYGDPTTLISDLTKFQTADTAPDSIYGNGVWLASQTQTTAQQIGAILKVGLKDIGETPDPAERLQELTELLTGTGGVAPQATTLKSNIDAFQQKTTGFYSTLNTQLTGDTNSLGSYLKQSGNVLDLAKQDVSDDAKAITDMNKQIKQLNDEYIGFTVAASSSPLLLVIPVFGPILAVADATTFGVLATKVKEQIDNLKKSLAAQQKDKQLKAALVTTLTGFNEKSADVETDGKAFLDTIGGMISGWSEFNSQIDLRLKSLTPDDLKDWSAFLQKIGFQTALDGWQLIEQKSEAFYQTGFVKFSQQDS